MSEQTGPWGDAPPPATVEALVLKCPACGKKNEIAPGASLVCQKCQQPLGRKKTNLKTKLKPIAALMVLASGGTMFVADHFTDNRYPILEEHAIIEGCVGGSMKTLTKRDFEVKRNLCGCALEEAQVNFDFDRFSDDRKGFFLALSQGLQSCR